MTSNFFDHNAVEVFLKSWGLYQEIIRHNYMFHNEIASAVRKDLSAFKPDQPLRVLDLGCGDGSMTLGLLPPERISSYIGCDLSKPALDIASNQINLLGISAKLLCDDMLNVVCEQSGGNVDLVLSSYAIHHLNSQKKQQLLKQIARALKPKGQFVLIDIFREPNETRADYMAHYMSALRDTWSNLSEAEQALVVNHATEYDFPEKTDFYEAACFKNGLSPGINLAKHTWHQAWLFSKPN